MDFEDENPAQIEKNSIEKIEMKIIPSPYSNIAYFLETIRGNPRISSTFYPRIK